MGISQQIGSSSLSKPGVCTSTTRPATPYEGQMIYETDTDKVLVYNGSAWYANWNTAWGLVSVTNTTSSSGAVSTETLRVTSPSFTAVANRYYRITYVEPVLQYYAGTVNQIVLKIRITNSAGAIQQFVEVRNLNTPTGGNNPATVSIVKTLSAGATVFVGTLHPTGGGTGGGYSAADAICQLIIEDIGPA